MSQSIHRTDRGSNKHKFLPVINTAFPSGETVRRLNTKLTTTALATTMSMTPKEQINMFFASPQSRRQKQRVFLVSAFAVPVSHSCVFSRFVEQTRKKCLLLRGSGNRSILLVEIRVPRTSCVVVTPQRSGHSRRIPSQAHEINTFILFLVNQPRCLFL